MRYFEGPPQAQFPPAQIINTVVCKDCIQPHLRPANTPCFRQLKPRD
jgi:hypothetical protein